MTADRPARQVPKGPRGPAGRNRPLSAKRRVTYAYFMVTLIVGAIMVLDMLIRLDVGRHVFSVVYFLPAFAVAYLVAPWIAKRIAGR
jgi:hypothetical protein